MRIELEYNARSIPPADVARSFIPPSPHFGRLLARNHTLLLGPRGSGKTTLLKMLTARALNSWTHPDARTLAPQVTFNAAFVPADIAWGGQIEAVGSLDFNSSRKDAAFVLHTLRAIIHAMREATELSRDGKIRPHAEHLAINLMTSQEEQFVKLVAPNLDVRPPLPSLLGLEIALEGRLDAINSGESVGPFTVDAFPSKISLLISAFNGITFNDDRRWALLFDELEIAPTPIKSFLLSGIRGFDERVIVKLALAPYMDDVGFDKKPTAPQPLHDYHTIQLTYPNKDDAARFGSELFTKTFARIGVEAPLLETMFESPHGAAQFGRRTKQKRRGVPASFGNEWHPYRAVWPVVPVEGLVIEPATESAAKSDDPTARDLLNTSNSIQRQRFAKLLSFLRAGRLLGEGVPAAGGANAAIPPAIWQQDGIYIDLENGDLLEASLRAKDRLSCPLRPLFTGLVLRKPESVHRFAEIRPTEILPIPTPKISVSKKNVTSKTTIERACCDWLVDLMRRSPDVRPEIQDFYWREAQMKWPKGLSGRGFERAWAKAIEEASAPEWSAVGRPRKSVQAKSPHQ